jgi:hypothetical protein
MANETETIVRRDLRKLQEAIVKEIHQAFVIQILIGYVTTTGLQKAQAFRKKGLLPAVTTMVNYLMSNRCDSANG